MDVTNEHPVSDRQVICRHIGSRGRIRVSEMGAKAVAVDIRDRVLAISAEVVDKMCRAGALKYVTTESTPYCHVFTAH